MNRAGVYRCLTADNNVYYVFVTGGTPFLTVAKVVSRAGVEAKLTMSEGLVFIDGPLVTKVEEV